ncbi:MAG: peptide-methionine (R)-S-oxide reductase MsrB [Patescibacteria group bacterium]|nr:peptide-methionine (R)-S-oxide reductase MsrB [Patescibacteria group bacterium]
MTVQLTDDEWRKKLSPEQYNVLREKGTEAPFTGHLLNEKGTGDFVCAACGNVVFKSDTKYESTTPGLIGWPAFSDVARSDAVSLVSDSSFGMERTEVNCNNCGGHLGHFFDDPSSPNGKHYCINSASLDFKDKSKE